MCDGRNRDLFTAGFLIVPKHARETRRLANQLHDVIVIRMRIAVKAS